MFVFDPSGGALELYARGGRKVHTPLQQAFCRALLAMDVGPADPLSPAYHLDHMLNPNFPLATDPNHRIAETRITKLRLEFRGACGGYVKVKANPKGPRSEIYDMILQKLNVHAINSSEVRVKQAGFQLIFINDTGVRPRSLSFNVGYPNSCDLKSKPEPMRVIGEGCLKLWGIVR